MNETLNEKIERLLEQYEQIVKKEKASNQKGFDLRELNQHLLTKQDIRPANSGDFSKMRLTEI